MGLLADAFSYGNGLKRKVNGLLADPVGTLELGVNRLGEDQNKLLALMKDVMPAGRYVAPEVRKNALKELADYGSQVGIAGMFVGPKSQTWDKAAAAKAQELAKKGTDPRKIWSETGTWKGPDGMWRQEIDDSAARMDAHSMRYLESAQAINPLKTGKLSDVLTHRKVYGAYPDAQDIGVDLAYSKNGGAYAPKTEWGDPEQLAIGPVADPRSTALHELQHAIQQREGWARGGSPENFNQQDIAKKASDMLAWQREVKSRLEKNPALDWHSAENAAVKEYESIGWPEAIPSPEVRKMAVNPMAYFESQPEEFVKLYGLDKRTTPYTGNELYKRLAGEAEARATQARLPLTAEQRRATFPEDSYDVPINNLILRGLLAP